MTKVVLVKECNVGIFFRVLRFDNLAARNMRL